MTTPLMSDDDDTEIVKIFLEQARQTLRKAMMFDMNQKTHETLILVCGLLQSRLGELWGKLETFPDEAFREQLDRVLGAGDTE